MVFKLKPYTIKEHAIQESIVSALRASGFITICTDVMTGLGQQKNKDDQSKRIRFIKHYQSLGYTNGQPDLIAIKSGYPVLLIEVKTIDGKQSESQKEFEKRINDFNDADCVYAVIRNADELFDLIRPF